MQCAECKKRPATIHFTKIENGSKTELRLCEICASKRGEKVSTLNSTFSFHQLLSGLLNLNSDHTTEPSKSDVAVKKEILSCPFCSTTYSQFSKTGRFGCAECYTTFGDSLGSLFRRIHGATKHRGKLPLKARNEIYTQQTIQKLKDLLAVKIEQEEFEEAAKIRDKIRSLKNKED